MSRIFLVMAVRQRRERAPQVHRPRGPLPRVRLFPFFFHANKDYHSFFFGGGGVSLFPPLLKPLHRGQRVRRHIGSAVFFSFSRRGAAKGLGEGDFFSFWFLFVFFIVWGQEANTERRNRGQGDIVASRTKKDKSPTRPTPAADAIQPFGRAIRPLGDAACAALSRSACVARRAPLAKGQ